MNRAIKLKELLSKGVTRKGVVTYSNETLIVNFSGDVVTFPKQDFSVGDQVILDNGILKKAVNPTAFFEV
jgi:hypothetical protein